jgi:hypothetical protein
MKKIVFLACIIFFMSNIAFALNITPHKNVFSLDPGQEKNIILTLKNNKDIKQVFVTEIETYIANDKDGLPDLTTKINDLQSEQNLINWIIFLKNDKEILPKDFQIELEPKQEKKIKIKIKAPKNAFVGGHYGSIIFKQKQEQKSGINIFTRVPSLLLIKINGKEKYAGKVLDFNLQNKKLKKDQELIFNINFQNNGNIHVKPKGSIILFNKKNEQIKNIFSFFDNSGKEIFLNEIPINQSEGYVLPNSNRIYVAKSLKNIFDNEIKARLVLNFNENSKPIIKEIKLKINKNINLLFFLLICLIIIILLFSFKFKFKFKIKKKKKCKIKKAK